jgi:activating signal cointegrator 1
MKAITIHQPWATLVALGEKQFETRSWATKYRGPLVIHAGQKIDRKSCDRAMIKSTLEKHGLTMDELQTGVIVAICNLVDCLKVRRPYGADSVVCLDSLDSVNGRSILWGGRLQGENDFGDYSDGRYAWELTDVQMLTEPIPAKGRQGLWNWKDQFDGT